MQDESARPDPEPSSGTRAGAGGTSSGGYGQPGHDAPLDPLDATILDHLSRDARASFAAIGALVNLSPSAVKRRVDRLRSRGVIDAFTVRLDPTALGWATEAHVEVHCTGSTSPATMREAFSRYPEVVAASTVTGDADAVVHVRAHDVRHLDEVVERINAEPFVVRTRSAVVLTALVRRDTATVRRGLPPRRDGTSPEHDGASPGRASASPEPGQAPPA